MLSIDTQYGVSGKVIQTCQKCSKEYPSISSLWLHYKQDHNHTASINCNFCSFTTANQHKYFNHINKQHQGYVKNIWLACTQCNKYFDHIAPLKKHNAHKHKLEMSKVTATKVLKTSFNNNNQFLDNAQVQQMQQNHICGI